MLDATNVFTLLQSSTRFLESQKLQDAKIEAEFLLSAALNVKRSKLAIIRGYKPTENETNLFTQYVKRRSEREPAAYITGSCGFMGLEFSVDKNVLIPRPETELLVEKVLERTGEISRKAKILDLCTGSGCIAVSLSKLGSFYVTASDISRKALDIAKKNAVANNALNIEFIRSDIFEALGDRQFDIIVSNPPYVSNDEYADLEPELMYEPKIALATEENGLFFYKKIALEAKKYLNDSGILFLELNANKSVEIKQIFQDNDFKNIDIFNDYSNLPRVLKADIKGS